jgi:hypothetical protein
LLRRKPVIRGILSGAGNLSGRFFMLLTIALVLLVLWALGVFAFKVTAGLIHILLVLALIVGLVQLFTGRRVV